MQVDAQTELLANAEIKKIAASVRWSVRREASILRAGSAAAERFHDFRANYFPRADKIISRQSGPPALGRPPTQANRPIQDPSTE
jgi:hypothetical protein